MSDVCADEGVQPPGRTTEAVQGLLRAHECPLQHCGGARYQPQGRPAAVSLEGKWGGWEGRGEREKVGEGGVMEGRMKGRKVQTMLD